MTPTRSRGLARTRFRAAQRLLMCSLALTGLACEQEPRRKQAEAAEDTAEPQYPPPVAAAPVPPAPPPAEPPASLAEAGPTPVAPPPPSPPPNPAPPPKMQVLVSETPAVDPAKLLLVGYERLGKPRNREPIEVNTDRNAVEFPASVTSGKVRGVTVPAGVGAGQALVHSTAQRAMKLQFRLEDQKAEYAGCLGKSDCGCEDVVPYAYVSVSQDLPPETRLDQFKALSFWARSQEPFELHVVLSCYIEPRPKSTVPPYNGYLDDAHTQMDPCWQAPRVELNLADPIEIRGDDLWHRYQVSLADLKPGEPVKLHGGQQMVCTLDKVTEVAYVLKKSHPPEPGEYPKDEGVVYFDDLAALVGP